MGAIPSYRTWVAGEVVTAAYFNSNVRDNGNWMLSMYLAILRQTVAQTFTTAITANLTLDAEDVDFDNGHSTVTNTDRYTAQTPARYQISGSAGWATSAAGIRANDWQLNGSAINGGSHTVPGVTGFETRMALKTLHIFMNANDFVNLSGFQNSGGNLNSATAGSSQTRVDIRLVGAS